MERLIIGYGIICLICYIRMIYKFWSKDEEIENIIESITYMLNILIKSNLDKNTVKIVLLLLFSLAIPILPISIVLSKED